MKQSSAKILVILIAIILIIGGIIIFTKGLNFELKYQDNQKIEIKLGKEFEKNDIKEIVSEVLGNQQVIIQEVDEYKDSVSITTTQINEEQRDSIVAKINEKYETQISAENVVIENISHVKGRDIIKPYIIPFGVATAIIIIYLVIRYIKLNSLEVLTQSIGIIVLAQLVLLGIMVITRMPVGKFTIPTILLVYMISTYICTVKFEEDLDKINMDAKKE